MAGGTDSATSTGVGRRLEAVVWGTTDTRVRATWRVLLAVPVLWILTGGVLAGNVQSAIGVIPPASAPWGGLAQSLLHAGFFLLALALWARYLDRRPLSDYGVSATGAWGLDFLVGFVALLLGFGFWIGVGSALGATTVEVSPSLPEGSLLLGLVVPFVALVLHAAVQQIVFFRIVLETAAEGLHGRGGSAGHATVAAIPVVVSLFLLIHELTALRALDIAVAGVVFSLLYLHTGDLALGIGAHFGSLYAGIVLSAMVGTSGSLPGVLGVVNRYGFPKVVVAYVLLVAWVHWRHGELAIRNGVARHADS